MTVELEQAEDLDPKCFTRSSREFSELKSACLELCDSPRNKAGRGNAPWDVYRKVTEHLEEPRQGPGSFCWVDFLSWSHLLSSLQNLHCVYGPWVWASRGAVRPAPAESELVFSGNTSLTEGLKKGFHKRLIVSNWPQVDNGWSCVFLKIILEREKQVPLFHEGSKDRGRADSVSDSLSLFQGIHQSYSDF